VNTAGPIVSGVALQKAGRKITGIVIKFNQALSTASASNPASYSVHLLRAGRRLSNGQRQLTPHVTVAIRAPQYDSSARAVTLTFSSRLRAHEMFQLTVNGGQVGITNAAGTPLNSPSQAAPGSNATFTLN
jgi:hypothetical protein